MSIWEASDRAVREDARASLVARVVGVTFVPAGLVKFVAYDWELGNFHRFGLVVAPAWVVAAGVIEIVCGVSLARCRAVVPSCVLLAITMVVAIAVSGIAQGDLVPSLTVAPALLAGTLFVLHRARARQPRLGPAGTEVAG